jgi:GT2 family glycosyltransferase
MIAVSVVICAHDTGRWDRLEAAIGSVLAQSRPVHEIVLVIDHNPELFRRASTRWPDTQVVENVEPRGLSGARNTGVARASGTHLAFLDDDAVADPDWVRELLTGYASPEVIAVGGEVVPRWLSQRPRWFPPEFDWIVGCSYTGMPRHDQPVRNLIGANMSFRADVLVGLGGFHREIGRLGSLPLGCEETELCIRARQRHPGSVVLYRPAARVWHSVPPDRARWRYFLSRCRAEGESKAVVTRLVGSGAALATERRYVAQTLPRGVLGGFGDALQRRDAYGLARAGAIIIGLATTAAGYTVRRLRHRWKRGAAT